MPDPSPTTEPPRDHGPVAPHAPHDTPDAPRDAATLARGADGRTAVRLFHLQRDRDVTGMSGTGVVADGALWPDCTVSIRWRGDRPSTVTWNSIDHAEQVHGHGGLTRIIWADEPPTYPCACGDEWPDPAMGCGHTAWRCESTDGAGMFDPHAILAPDSTADTETDGCLTRMDAVRAAPDDELTEARALVDDLDLQLYRAEDALAFVAECCTIAERENRTITTANVREWLKGARCGRQRLADRPAPDDALREQCAAAIERVRAEHQPDGGHCGICADPDGSAARWPCPTIRALDGTEQPTT